MFGADDKNRTYDLLITSQLLYQLSYVGVGARIIGSVFVFVKTIFKNFLN